MPKNLDLDRMTLEELKEEVARLREGMRKMAELLQDDIKRVTRELEMISPIRGRAEQSPPKGMGR